MKAILRFLVLVGILLGAARLLAAPPVNVLRSELLQVALNSTNGQLVQSTDLRTHWSALTDSPSPTDLWTVEILRNGKRSIVTPAQAAHFRLEQRERGRGARLVWFNFPLGIPPRLEVTVEVQLEKQRPLSRWTLAVEGCRGAVLEKVHFPRLPAIRAQAEERLAVPVWMGQLAENPRAMFLGVPGKEKRIEWEYPGLASLQCLALYGKEGPGLYFSCDDIASYRKGFAMWGSPGQELHYEMIHLPETRAADRWQMPYAAILGGIQGDWFNAAEQYRSWATNQPWARESRLARGLTAKWAVETGMWVWNRGRSTEVLQPAMALQKELGLPVRVFWHWWHGCAYDTGFPEYLPPREGIGAFTNALVEAHRHDVRAIVYMNQRLWGMSTESWKREGAERYAVKGADGTVHPEVYNTFTKLPCASMCMGTAFWRDHYASLAERAVGELGVDGIYMDQACSSLACFDAAHGHPLGGGRYWIDGFRQMSGDIRARCQSSGPTVLAGEGCGEGWLPFLDLMLSLQVSKERYANPEDGWSPIPFFQAVYHPYCIQYGNYSSLTMPPYDDLWPAEYAPAEPLKLLDRKYSQQFYLEQARAFVWGQQPTVANFLASQLTARREETAYMMQLAKLRTRASKYLQGGTFLRPPVIEVPEARLAMSRLSIYAGQQGALRSFERSYPLVLSGAWGALDGSVAVALASIAETPLTAQLRMPKHDQLPRTRAYRMGPGGESLPLHYDGAEVFLNVPLGAREACVLVFAR